MTTVRAEMVVLADMIWRGRATVGKLAVVKFKLAITACAEMVVLNVLRLKSDFFQAMMKSQIIRSHAVQ